MVEPRSERGRSGPIPFSSIDQRYGLPVGTLASMWMQESTCGADLTAYRGDACGHFQFTPIAVRDIRQNGYNGPDPRAPGTSIDDQADAAGFYLQMLMRRGGNLSNALTLYHSGRLDNLGPVGMDYANEIIARLDNRRELQSYNQFYERYYRDREEPRSRRPITIDPTFSWDSNTSDAGEAEVQRDPALDRDTGHSTSPGGMIGGIMGALLGAFMGNGIMRWVLMAVGGLAGYFLGNNLSREAHTPDARGDISLADSPADSMDRAVAFARGASVMPAGISAPQDANAGEILSSPAIAPSALAASLLPAPR